jgi:Rrf2 family iron-sulfur cluster assembly transcriptional regulator
MIILSRRSMLAIAATVDVALFARPDPVSTKQMAQRHNLPPRHLESLLQTLVRSGILKGMRGPRGGYSLARERRRISIGDIVRASLQPVNGSAGEDEETRSINSPLVETVVQPMIARASEAFLQSLDGISVEDLCNKAEAEGLEGGYALNADFTI